MPECDKGVGIDDLSVAYSAMLRRPCPAIATLAVDWCLQFDVTTHVHRPAVASTPRRTIERAAPITPRSTRLDSNLFDFVPPKWCDKASQDTRDKIIAALAAMEVYTIGDLLAVEACGKSSMIKRLEDALGLVQDGIEAHRGIQFMNYVDLIKNLQQAVPPPRPTIVGKDVICVGAPVPCSANRLVLNALSCCAAGELLPPVTTVFKRPDTRLDSNLFDFVPPKWCDKASQDTRDKIIAALAAMEVYTIGDLLAVEACGKSSMIKRLEDALGLVQDGIEAHRGIQFMNYVDLIKNLQQAVPPPRPTIVGKDVICVGAPVPCSANRLVLNALSCCAAGELLPRVTTVFKRPDYQVTESEGEGARVWHVKLNVCALNDGRRTVKTVTAGLVTDANQSIIAIPLDKKTHEPRPFTDKQAKSAGTCQAMAWAVYYDADKYHQNPNKQMADVATLNVNISML